MGGAILMFLGGLFCIVVWLYPPHTADAVAAAVTWAAAIAQAFHPWHELRVGFRDAVNDRLLGVRSGSLEAMLVRSQRYVPLSKRRAVFQTILLSVARSAVVLWGPVWLLPPLLGFSAADVSWTHGHHRVPGRWSAWVELTAVAALASVRAPELVTWLAAAPSLHLAAFLFTLAAGVGALAAFWWRLRRQVRRED